MNPLPNLILPLLLAAPIAEGWLGVYLDSDRKEAVVQEVIPGSPADKAGLAAGDVLLAVAEKLTPTREEFVAAIRSHEAGDRVKIKYRRGDRESVATVKLAQRAEEATPPTATKPAPRTEPKDKPAPPRPAIEVAPMEPKAPPAGGKRPYLGLSVKTVDDGVVIDRIVAGGPAAGSSLEVGDRITSLGDQPIHGLADIDQALGRMAPGQKVAVGIARRDGKASVMLSLGERVDQVAPPVAAPAPKPPHLAEPPAKSSTPPRDFDAEIEALRQELRELRKQLEDLRRESRSK